MQVAWSANYDVLESVTQRLRGFQIARTQIFQRTALIAAPALAATLPQHPAGQLVRAETVNDLAHQVQHRRLLTIIGPAGTGKTTINSSTL